MPKGQKQTLVDNLQNNSQNTPFYSRKKSTKVTTRTRLI